MPALMPRQRADAATPLMLYTFATCSLRHYATLAAAFELYAALLPLIAAIRLLMPMLIID